MNVKSPTEMVVNQNYDRAWKLYRGEGQVFPYNGVLAVRLPAGTQRLELRYRDDRFTPGVLIFFVGLLLTVAIVRYENRARGPRT